jgi:hypothetical protein
MDDELWSFGVAQPAVVHKGTNDGTYPVCLAARQEYGIGKVGKSRFVCGPDDTPDPKKFVGYAGVTWCPDCEWALAHMRTPEFMESLQRRGPTIPLIVVSVGGL